ncbi:hypothetical protein OUZ56_002606 [Daphnia magna]|uniref:Uncharacterized protein n=1 Tax=Daphnia magna TaxID=35525 RepID=A0ABR0A670_9CRUS|nr:hypothetical protein OUZ56_002606 [Daphnia magna]
MSTTNNRAAERSKPSTATIIKMTDWKIYHRDAITRFVSVLQIEFDVRHHGAYPRAKRKKKNVRCIREPCDGMAGSF